MLIPFGILSAAASVALQDVIVKFLVLAGGAGGASGGGGAGGYRLSITGESSGANSSAESPITLNLYKLRCHCWCCWCCWN